jgi:hypothetical protein
MTLWAFLKLVLAFAVVWTMGYAVLATAFGRQKLIAPAERFFLAFVLGAGALTLLLTYVGFLGLRLHFSYCLICALIVLVPWLLWLSKIGRLNFDFHDVIQTFRKIFNLFGQRNYLFKYALLFIIIYQIIFVFAENILRPVSMGDALGFWGLCVKMVHFLHIMPPEDFASGREFYTGFHNATIYPPMLYMLGFWICAAAGYVSSSLCKLLLVIYFSAFLALFYYALRRLLDQTFSLAFTALLALTPVLSRGFTCFFADAILTAFLSLAVIYLYLYLVFREKHWLILSSLLFALAAWTKVEGSIYFFLGFLTLAMFFVFLRGVPLRQKIHRLLLFIAVPLIIILPYYTIRMQRRATHLFLNPGGEYRKFDKIKELKLVDDRIFPQIYENLASYRAFIYQHRYFRSTKLGDWLFLWPAFVFALFISPGRIIRGKLYYILLFMLAYFAFHYYVAIMLGPIAPQFHFSRGFARHFMHCAGFVTFIIAILLYPRELNLNNGENLLPK